MNGTDLDFPALIDKFLLGRRDAEGNREIVGNATWRGSKLGSCLRQQYIEFFLKQPKLEQFSATTLRRFEVGHAWSAIFKGWFEDMGLLAHEEMEFFDADLDVGAHADFLLGIEGKLIAGIELKSVNSKAFWYRAKQADTTASPENMMQTALYDILARKQGIEIPWYVVTVSKDDLQMNQDQVTQAHRDEALARLATLNEAKLLGVPPPCSCMDPNGAFNGNGWKWCPYSESSDDAKTTSVSQKIEGETYANGKPKYSKKYIPDGECCAVKEVAHV